MMVLLAGCALIDGSTHAAETVTVTALLSMLPHWPVTCAKYVVLVVGDTGSVALVAPGIDVPFGGVPVSHWKVSPVPLAVTARVALWPDWMAAGVAVATAFDGAAHTRPAGPGTALLVI